MTLQMKMDERYEAGMEAGMELGMEAGENNKLKNQIEKKLKKGKTIQQIADECEESVENIQRLMEDM